MVAIAVVFQGIGVSIHGVDDLGNADAKPLSRFGRNRGEQNHRQTFACRNRSSRQTEPTLTAPGFPAGGDRLDPTSAPKLLTTASTSPARAAPWAANQASFGKPGTSLTVMVAPAAFASSTAAWKPAAVDEHGDAKIRAAIGIDELGFALIQNRFGHGIHAIVIAVAIDDTAQVVGVGLVFFIDISGSSAMPQ